MKKFPFRLAFLDQTRVDDAICLALREDLGEKGDITTEALFRDQKPFKRAVILAKQEGIVCGVSVVLRTFSLLDTSLQVKTHVQDGDYVKRGDILVEIRGSVQSILSGERVALNFLGMMSGIATKTRQIVEMIRGTNLKILDTRKTLPGLRMFEKYAVAVGGGYNHRYGLYDMILIKENHCAAVGGLAIAVKRARDLYSDILIEVEVSTLDQVKEALETDADILMLDNMTDEQIQQSLVLIGKRKLVEASGNMTEERVKILALMGVDFISMGILTHTICPLDVSLLMEDFL